MKKILCLMIFGLVSFRGFAQMPVYDASTVGQLLAIGSSIEQQVKQASKLLNLMDETKRIRQKVSASVKTLTEVHKIVSMTTRVVNDAQTLSRIITQSKILTARQAVNYSQRCLSYVEIIYKNIERLNQILSDGVFEVEESSRIAMIDQVNAEIAYKQKELEQTKREIMTLEKRYVLIRMAQMQTKTR